MNSAARPPSLSVPARAVVLTELFPPKVGGSGALLHEVYSRLGDVQVTVLTDGPGGAEEERMAGMRVIRRPMAARGWGLMRPPSARRYLSVADSLRRSCAEQPTVVHCGRLLPEGLSARLGCAWTRTHFLCWAHGEELVYVASSRELTWLASRVHASASAVLANSQNTAGILRAFGVASDKIHVVHPGVDTRRFRPDLDASALRQRYAPAGEMILLAVGRLQRRKGHDLSLRAIAKLGRRDIRYLIIGDGEQRDYLRQLADDLGIRALVSFEHEVTPELLPLFYAAADIFLHPNRQEHNDVEGFGLVFLEAAAAGVPAIGGRSGGVPEAVVDGESGVLVSATSVDELTATLRRLLDDAQCRQSMGKTARDRVLREFTWDKAAALVRDIHLRLSRDP